MKKLTAAVLVTLICTAASAEQGRDRQSILRDTFAAHMNRESEGTFTVSVRGTKLLVRIEDAGARHTVDALDEEGACDLLLHMLYGSVPDMRRYGFTHVRWLGDIRRMDCSL